MRVDRPHRQRLKAIAVGMVVLGAALAFRLGSVQLLSGEAYAARAKDQHQKTVTLQGNRGQVLDRHGRVLATNLEAESFFVNGTSGSEDLRSIALSFRGSTRDSRVLKRLRENRFVWLARKVLDAPEENQIPDGVARVVEMRRYYPMEQLAGQVIGYTDIDNVGIEGLELTFNDHLRGTGGEMLSWVDARGRAMGAVGRVQRYPENGTELDLTLDSDYQAIAEEELSAAVSLSGALNGVAIVTSPRTGEIFAMANVPLYSPNRFSRHAADVRRNRTVTDLFEPGSTLKIVTLSAALEEETATPERRVFCEHGKMSISGSVIRDSHPSGWLTVREIMQESSNIGTIKLARELGKVSLYRYLRLFGLGSATGVELPGESGGSLQHPSRWSRRSLETISIGQEIGVTALQLAAAYGVVANGGELVVPRIRLNSKKPDVLRRVISKATAKTVTEILEGVVLHGTGENAQVAGYRVAGKTGTAQAASSHGAGYDPDRYVASFVGYLPADRPEILCVVAIDGPQEAHTGSQIAAPVFKRIVERILSLRRSPLRHLATRSEDVRLETMVSTEDRDVAPRDTKHQTPRRLVAVPDVLGSNLRHAVAELTSSGLLVRTQGSGRVVKQLPEPGEAVSRGTVCRIICAVENG